jgi:DNA-binding response OmpR family regulator
MNNAILVIENDSLDSAVLECALSFAGFAPYLVGSGLDAFDALRSGKFALILTSLNVQDMDGLQLLKILRQHSFAPIIALSDALDAPSRIGALDRGADDLVAKSISPGELLARVRSALRRSGMPSLPLGGVDTQALEPGRPDGDDTAFETIAGRHPIRFGDLVLNEEGLRIEAGDRKVNLTLQEFKILRALVVNRNAIVTKQLLLRALGGGNITTDTKVVEVYVSRLRHILRDLDGEKWEIRNRRGIGWSLVGEERGEGADVPAGK